jgi:hypothetical protein
VHALRGPEHQPVPQVVGRFRGKDTVVGKLTCSTMMAFW